MCRTLFPDVKTPISWLICDESVVKHCFVEDMNRLSEVRRGKLQARMLAWARANSWLVVNEEIMHRLKDTDPPVYELKCFQERVLFIRDGQDAVAFGLYSKKVGWDKRAQKAVDSLLKLAGPAAAACKGVGRRTG